jgi:TolB-like protein
MAVLVELASKGRNTLSREQLISTVWPRGFVSDDVLNRCISQLRAALGDDPRSPAYIDTIPRKGYRLVASVIVPESGPEEGILVLPFQNLAAHGGDEYLADGLTELLIARMAVTSGQRVISRTTAMTFKNRNQSMQTLREKLHVKWVIEGSLLHLGNNLQIVVQLIDSESDAHVWADTWTRPAEDVMTVLNEVSRQVSNQIQSTLEGHQDATPVTDRLPSELMRRFLQGSHHASRRTASSLGLAQDCFEEVLDEVPEHAPALAGLAMCRMLLVHYGVQEASEGIPAAREYAKRALRHDPQNADAMSHLGAIHFFL